VCGQLGNFESEEIIEELQAKINQMEKEVRTLKRKLQLAETAHSRANAIAIMQERTESILKKSLQKQINYFQLVLENTINIIILLNPDGQFAYASKNFLTAIDIPAFGMIEGKHFNDVFAPVLSENMLKKLSGAIKASAAVKHTITLEEEIDFRNTGSPFSYSIYVTPMTKGNDDENTGFMILFNDNTKISNAMKLAQEASLAKTNFLANMSHEIRTPMNAIIGMTTIGMEYTDIERMKYCFSKISNASNHLLGVINDILDMSKIEANKFELVSESFNFETMLKNIVNMITFRIDERRHKFYVNVDNNIPRMLYGDDQRLSQVITNLLSNAIKFTPDEGTIRLNAELVSEESGNYCIKISVSDTGIGLTDEQQRRLFTAFEQAEAGTSRKYGGTGLGLVISKQIVEMMNGEIWIESDFGKGSTFSFTVLLKRGTDENEENERILIEKIKEKNLRIFAVDDEADIRDHFCNIAGNLNIDCTVASSGEQAEEMLATDNNYDIYFLDWRLPGMNGIDLSRLIISKNEDHPVVILFSSADWKLIEDEATEAGIERFLPKPIFQSAIIHAIRDCMGLDGDVKFDNAIPKTENFSGHTILLAEDVEINREIVLALLESTELKIECACNGHEAVEMFRKNPERYEMIFMDLQMPQMDGYEATTSIRNSGLPNCKLPIIAMTANVFREDVERCIETGMNGHIGKPLNINNVLEILRKYLN